MPLLACRDRGYRSEQDGEELEVLNYVAKQPSLHVSETQSPSLNPTLNPLIPDLNLLHNWPISCSEI